ncbi:MAG: hypothetical protein GWO86_02335, partial [Planctomycetes bacterium]|nr:hypothetical protein [Planctomycetota bacterium]
MFKHTTNLKTLLVLLFVLLLCRSVFAQSASKVETNRQIAKQLLLIGQEQYQRGLYSDAQLTLLKAAQYKEYLASGDVKNLNNILSRVIAKVSEENTTRNVQDATEEEEQQQVSPVEPEAAEPEVEVEELKEATPQAEEQAEETQQDEIQQDEEAPVLLPILPVTAEETPSGENFTEVENETQNLSAGATEIQSDVGDSREQSYIDVVNQKRRIQQSFTKAIVNDAITKAGEFSDKNKFAEAKDEIARATNVVNNNKLLLGDTAYRDYTDKLQELRKEIVDKQTVQAQAKAEQRRIEAEQTQKRIIEQQRLDREKRIKDLMNNALEYQDQQRYSEALGQLETLLAIDPTNHNAAITKRALEDTINLRRQIETKRQSEQQEIDIFNETQQSTIPHAKEISFPSNWLELTKKRKIKSMGNLSPVDIAVYKELETSVDLSALNPDMSLEEAIDEIRNSVDPPLKLIVRWRDLADNAYIERNTTIGMQGLSNIPLGKGLSELLKSVSGGIVEIRYAVDQGIITIATKEALPGRMVTDTYDVTELIGVKARYTIDLNIDVQSGTGGSSSGGEITQPTEQPTGTEDIENVASIIETIQQTIEPDSWYINGGQGSIIAHGAMLIIRQTPEIQEKVRKLMKDLRRSLGQQVAIESRFLFVSENFLEDIGIDADIQLLPFGGFRTNMNFNQNSYELAAPGSTKVPGSLATTTGGSPALSLAGLQYGSVLDDLSVSIMLRATQAHVDSKTLTAPKVTVLSGERAYIAITKGTAYIGDYDFQDITASGDNQPVRVIADPQIETTTGGVLLNVTPTVSPDKRYVLLDISTSYADNDLKDFSVFSEVTGQGYPIQLPVVERAQVQTRVSIP